MNVHPAGLVLGIETATALGGVALVSGGGELLGEITLLNHESHAERILPAAEWLLATLGLSLRDLAAVAVSSGPGSFTGLRAGIATAKGLAFSLGVPLYGIPTLEALAANAPAGRRPGVRRAQRAPRRGLPRALSRRPRGPAAPRRRTAWSPLRALADELPAGCLVVGELPAGLRRDARRRPRRPLRPPAPGPPAGRGDRGARQRRARARGRASELTTLLPALPAPLRRRGRRAARPINRPHCHGVARGALR